MATHAGMSIAEFDAIVSQWIATARHPVMLQWTCVRGETRLCLYVHHTDAQREWAYDHQSAIGELNKGLEQAAVSGWTVLSMKDDWKSIYPAAK